MKFINLILILCILNYKTSAKNFRFETKFFFNKSIEVNDSNTFKIHIDSINYLLKNDLINLDSSITILLYGNRAYEREKNEENAIKIYHESLKYRKDGYFDAFYNIGILYYNKEEYDSSLVYLEKAIHYNSDNDICVKTLANIYARKGRIKEALIFSINNTTIISELAMSAKEGGHYKDAILLAENALVLDTNDAKAYYVKGICYARYLNKLKNGIPYLEKAISIEKENSYWLEDLAVAYGMMGKYAKTIPLLKKVIELRPDDPSGYNNISATYSKMGDETKAEYYFDLGNEKGTNK